MAGTSASGAVVNANDSVSVCGEVMAISGTGQRATITVKTQNGSTFNVQAGDCFAPQGVGPAISENGKPFGLGSQVTVKATVTSVSGAGVTATLTVKTNSTPAVSVPTQSAHAPRTH